MSKAIRIVSKQYKSCKDDPIDGIYLSDIDDKNALTFNFTINGPADSPWADCLIYGKLECPENYPFAPPSVTFLSETYHPNIYTDGKVCLSILNNKQDETGYFRNDELWTPALDLRSVLLIIMNLFNEPNLESPANLDACILYRQNRKEFTKKVRHLLNNSEKYIDVDTKTIVANKNLCDKTESNVVDL